MARKKLALPEYLYRGDEDKTGVRKLRATLPTRRFNANPVNGGTGRIIFENPLMNGIEKNMGRALRETAFLSFTENLSIAYAYGASNYHLRKEEIENDFWEYRGEDPEWDFSILTLHVWDIAWYPLVKGFYEGRYEAGDGTGQARVLLVDVAAVLKDWRSHDEPYTKAYAAALRDTEWLLLPDIASPEDEGAPEPVGMLDGKHISVNTMMRKANGKPPGE